jgi:hypothetical protein
MYVARGVYVCVMVCIIGVIHFGLPTFPSLYYTLFFAQCAIIDTCYQLLYSTIEGTQNEERMRERIEKAKREGGERKQSERGEGGERRRERDSQVQEKVLWEVARDLALSPL